MLEVGGCAVGNHEVGLPCHRIKRLPGVRSVFGVGHLLRPPAFAFRAELDVVGARAAHAEDLSPCDVERLAAHQVEDRVVDAVNASAVPHLDRHFVQSVEVLVVAVDEQRGEGFLREPAQPVFFAPCRLNRVKHQPEVPRDDEVVVLVELARIEPVGRELADVVVPVRVAGHEQTIRHASPFLALSACAPRAFYFNDSSGGFRTICEKRDKSGTGCRVPVS